MSNYTIAFKDSDNYNEMLHDTTGRVVFAYNTQQIRIMWYEVHHDVVNVDGHIFVFNQLFETIKKWIGRDISRYFDPVFAPHLPNTEDRVVLNIKRPFLNDPGVKTISKFLNFRFTMRPKLTLFLPQKSESALMNLNIPLTEGPSDADQQNRDIGNCNNDYQFPPAFTRDPYVPQPLARSTPLPTPDPRPLSTQGEFFVAEPTRGDQEEEILIEESAAILIEESRAGQKRNHDSDSSLSNDDNDDDHDSVSTGEESVLDVDEIQSQIASTLRSSFIGNVKKLKIYNEKITEPLRTIAERIINNDMAPQNASAIVETAFRTLQTDMIIHADNSNIPSPINTPNTFRTFLYDVMNDALRVGDEKSIARFISVLRRILPSFKTDNFDVPFDSVNLL